MKEKKYLDILSALKKEVALYEPSPLPFWDDTHISEKMLSSHLDPNVDGASRKMEFIERSADWLSSRMSGKDMLDLGCGPGLYAEAMCARGAAVCGIDFSARSIRYAEESARKKGLDITYHYQNYLTIDYSEQFDTAIIVYCDFGVLSPTDRALLLEKTLRALRRGGKLILDAWNIPYMQSYRENDLISYCDGGFWSEQPYALLQKNRLYRETMNTLEEYVVVTEDDCKSYYIWNQVYSAETLAAELSAAGFSSVECFDDIAGSPYSGTAETLCAVAVK